MLNRKHILFFLFTVISVSLVYSQKLPRITGVYSNLQYGKESGDLIGMEVNIVYSTDGKNVQYYALVQEAKGVANPPVLVQVKVNKDEIEFTISDKEMNRTFRGKISKKELVGKFEGNDEAIQLKRKKSYWQ